MKCFLLVKKGMDLRYQSRETCRRENYQVLVIHWNLKEIEDNLGFFRVRGYQ